MLNRLPQQEGSGPEVENVVRDQLTEFLKEQRFGKTSEPVRKKKRLQVEAEKSISTLNALLEQDVDENRIQRSEEETRENEAMANDNNQAGPTNVETQSANLNQTTLDDEDFTDCESDGYNDRGPQVGQFILVKFASKKGKKTYQCLLCYIISIDEQMIPFSGRCEYRQYVPSKPNPLGLKNFVLAARDGIVLDLEIYVGKDTVPQEVMRSLGLGAGIVQTLCRTIESECVLYTDQFLSSLKLAEHLNQSDKEIYLTGTVMMNRIGTVASKLKTDRQLERGEWDEKVRSDENVCVLKWKDTKAVTMLSTSVGNTPANTCKRWCKVQKRKIDVNQPAVVKNYNTCMGGIDLCGIL